MSKNPSCLCFVLAVSIIARALQGQSALNDSVKRAIVDSVKRAQLAHQKYRTSFIADGSLQNVLTGKSSETPATGSLGLLHAAPHERFRVLIALASNIDTLKSADRRAFARALLTPGAAGKGGGASGSADYHWFTEYRDRCVRAVRAVTDTTQRQRVQRQCRDSVERLDAAGELLHQTIGGRFYASFANATWRVTDTAGGTVSASDLTLLTFGGRAVWVPVNHPLDDKGNEFSFTAELGYTLRSLAGDAASDKDFRTAALGSGGKVFHGPELVASIRLNRVTGTALFTYLGLFGGPKLRGLTGLQPVVSFNIDAPVFTF
jgi:hypothetical protein